MEVEEDEEDEEKKAGSEEKGSHLAPGSERQREAWARLDA